MDNGSKRRAGFFRTKGMKYGVASAISVCVAVAIAVFANLIVGMFDIKADMTANKMYTVGDATRELLAGLTEKVEIIALFDEMTFTRSSSPEINDALKVLENYTGSQNVELRFVDPDKNPGTIEELDPDGLLELERNSFLVRRVQPNGVPKSIKIALADLFETQWSQETFQTYVTGIKAEEAFSGAIKYVSSDTTPTVYFAEGHGELAVDANYTVLRDFLSNNNFEVESLNLASAGAVPEGARLLVFAAPANDLLPAELDALSSYFASGGRAMFMFDYDERGTQLPNFNRLFESFGLALNNDAVRSDDERAHMVGDPFTIAYEVAESSVVPGSTLLILSDSRSVTVLGADETGVTHTSLVSTTAQSTSVPVASDGVERAGPLDIAVAAEGSGEDGVASRVIVAGNASFVADGASELYGTYYVNGVNVVIYSIMWLLGEQDELIIPPKLYEAPYVEITAFQARYLQICLMAALPVLIMVVGFAVFARRRRL